MPEGTRHQFVGHLATHGPDLVLEVGDGRRWQLNAPAGIKRLIGRSVRVTGTRGAGAILHVEAFAQIMG